MATPPSFIAASSPPPPAFRRPRSAIRRRPSAACRRPFAVRRPSLVMAVLRTVFIWRRQNAKGLVSEGPSRKKCKFAQKIMEKKNEDDDGYTSGEYTSEDDGYVWPNGIRRRTREEWAKYHKQIEESEGFDLDLFPGTSEHGYTALTNFDDESIIECTKAAIEHFNKENEASFRFVKIEKTICLVVAGLQYNITFQAIDGEASMQTFQAKTFYGLDRSITVYLCRLKPAAS